jgi:hypothetical protein
MRVVFLYTVRDSSTDELIRWGFVEDCRVEELVELYALSHGSDVYISTILQ